MMMQIPPLPSLGPEPVRATCPSCQALMTTRTDEVTSKFANLWCLLLCAFGCSLCSCIPYCMDRFKNVKHSCPECNAYIGTYETKQL